MNKTKKELFPNTVAFLVEVTLHVSDQANSAKEFRKLGEKLDTLCQLLSLPAWQEIYQARLSWVLFGLETFETHLVRRIESLSKQANYDGISAVHAFEKDRPTHPLDEIPCVPFGLFMDYEMIRAHVTSDPLKDPEFKEKAYDVAVALFLRLAEATKGTEFEALWRKRASDL